MARGEVSTSSDIRSPAFCSASASRPQVVYCCLLSPILVQSALRNTDGVPIRNMDHLRGVIEELSWSRISVFFFGC
jgi:hypothetical protein